MPVQTPPPRSLGASLSASSSAESPVSGFMAWEDEARLKNCMVITVVPQARATKHIWVLQNKYNEQPFESAAVRSAQAWLRATHAGLIPTSQGWPAVSYSSGLIHWAWDRGLVFFSHHCLILLMVCSGLPRNGKRPGEDLKPLVPLRPPPLP